MFKNLLHVTLRSLSRNKIYTLVNVAGLSLAFAAFILITAYVHFEKSYDDFQSATDTIYRVESSFYKNGQITDSWPTSTNGYGKAMKENLAGVSSFTRINWHNSERIVRYGQTKNREEHVCFADTNFFSFFPFPILRGNKETILRDVSTVAISASAAKKYFGDEDPVGKFLDISTISDNFHCMVSGVFKDMPRNATMQFNFLISWSTSPQWQRDFWYLHESYTYVKLYRDVNPASIETQFPALAEKYKTEDALKELKWAITLVPLKDIHLNDAKPNEIEAKGNRRAVQFLGALAFVIIAIAWVNYTNLSTAKAIDRAKEVGIRKISGAHKWQLFTQFLFESVCINLIALLSAATLVLAAKVFMPQFTGNGMMNGLLFDSFLLFKCIAIFIVGIILPAIYPAIIMSRLHPITILKGRYTFSKTGILIRKGLTILQFSFSLILIAGTLAIYRQINFMNSQSLGVDINQVLVMKAPASTQGYSQKTESFKNALKDIAGVTGVCGSGAVPGKEVGKFLANRKFGEGKEKDHLYETLQVDYDFISTFDLKLAAGRSFDKNRAADKFGVVINESAVKQFGFSSNEVAVGSKILLETAKSPSEIIGVIKDYHQQSLQQKYTPIVLLMDPAFEWIPVEYYSVKINTANVNGTIAKVRSAWNQLFPESSFDFFFLDDFYNKQYQQDRQFGKVFLIFSFMAIVIACMGLFGLTAYSTAKKTKEIGVRKVLGASVQHIVSLLTWDSVKLILISCLVAIPLSYWLIYQWIQSYSFRAPLTLWHFLLPVVSLIIIAIATISYITIKAALINPSISLKDE